MREKASQQLQWPPPKTWSEATLEDIVITPAPTEELYGYDHAPPIPSDPAEVGALSRHVDAELRQTFATLDPLTTLATLAVLLTTSRPGSPTLFVDEPDLEFAQAAFLQTGGGDKKPSLGDITRLCNNLRLFRALLLHNKKYEPNTGEWSLHQRRQETLNVRHTHYAPTSRHLAALIAERFGDRWATQLGFSLRQASAVIFGAADLVIESITSSAAAQASASWAKESLAGMISDPTWDAMTAVFEIHVQSLVERANSANSTQVESILDKLSLDHQQLRDAKLEYFPLDNPVWSAPVFKDQFGRRYLFSPALIYSFNNYQTARLLGSVTKLPDRELGQVRGSVLEDELARALGRMFPSAKILRSVKWTDSASRQEYETDAIVWIDDIMIVFEAKGNIINRAGRRGSHAYFDSVDFAVVGATLQAQRLRNNIFDAYGSFELRPDAGKERLPLIKSDISHVVCFGITLDRFISANYDADKALWDRVRKLGIEPMPILTIGDLLLIEELLKSEYERIHYFLRRTEIPFEFDFIGDELDLIALYLKAGFVVPKEWRRHQALLVLYGLSDFLRFYTRLSPYYDKNKPAPHRLMPGWRAEIERVWTKRSQKRIDISYDLLNVSLQQQQRFISDIRACKEKMRRTKKRDQVDGILHELLDRHNPSIIACLVHGSRAKLDFPGTFLRLVGNVGDAYPAARVICFRDITDLKESLPMFAVYRSTEWRHPGSNFKEHAT